MRSRKKLSAKAPRVATLLAPVCIEFYDHISDSAEEMEKEVVREGKAIEHGHCHVFGVIYKTTSLAYYVASWICDGEIKTQNTDAYKILKSTVIKITRLK